MSKPALVGIGAAVYDTLLMTNDFPAEDTKLRAQEIRFQGGGPCTTALAAAAKLGVSAAYIGACGTDPAGDCIARDMERFGVDVSRLKRVPGCLSFSSFVLLNRAASTRTCVAYPGTVPELDPEELPVELIQNARVLHLDGNHIDAALRAARLAREAGVSVCLDAGSPYPRIHELLPYTDWLIPSAEFVRRLTGETDPLTGARRLAKTYRPETLIVTEGVAGGFLLEWDGAVRRYPAFPVEAVDTNGAGDVFHGGYIAARLKGKNAYDAAVYASAVSAIKCTGFGARESSPCWAQVEDFLAHQ